MDELDIEKLVKDSVAGNKLSTEKLIRHIQNKVFSLCIRMLWNKEDAQEATQEILIKIITHLSQFKYECKFESWVYRISTNHLIDKKRSDARLKDISFYSFEQDLMSSQVIPSDHERNSPEYSLQLSEIRLSCTTALLQCLDHDLRISYIIGEILELDHKEAAMVLEIAPAAFRKRLERARERVETFTTNVCGVINPSGKCKCSNRLAYAKKCGNVDFKNFPYSNMSKSNLEIIEMIKKIDLLKRTTEHYKSTNNFTMVDEYRDFLDRLLEQ